MATPYPSPWFRLPAACRSFCSQSSAMAHILDKRRFLIIGETAYTLISAAFAVLVWRGLVTPSVLLAFTFLIGAAGAVTAPAWQAIVPLLVPPARPTDRRCSQQRRRQCEPRHWSSARRCDHPRVRNRRAVLDQRHLRRCGNSGARLVASAAARSGSSAARAPRQRTRVGLRNARHNSFLRSTLVRTVAFFLFASAYWAMLPLVARNQVAGGSARGMACCSGQSARERSAAPSVCPG